MQQELLFSKHKPSLCTGCTHHMAYKYWSGKEHRVHACTFKHSQDQRYSFSTMSTDWKGEPQPVRDCPFDTDLEM